jgi:hypothetical protein
MTDHMPPKNKMADTETKWLAQKQNGGHRNKIAGTEKKKKNGGHRNEMVDTETKWQTQKQNGGHRNKMADTETIWRTQKQNGGQWVTWNPTRLTSGA